ncbi:MAG TPA: aromatic ring-hydroxylating dioxygenase subunit alpha [Thermomicrobiales bacterium]|nr:aromatic ring-hydroxylating dioxygenase subunit alpha [Thermomicrobiales bacterium]
MVAVEPERAAFQPTLPGRYFHDPAIYAREQERIFGAMWVCVGRADAIPTAGEFMLADLGGESVIVARGHDGALRAFLNVCRHRGARLCTEAQGRAGRVFQCRYHAWSYGLDGRLVGTPNLTRDDRLDRDAYGLLPVRLEVWEGLVWLNLDPDAAPLADQLDPPIETRFGGSETLARYGIGDLGVGRSIQYEIAANWKLIVENFMECYHCGPVHPELVRLLPAFRQGTSYQGIVGEGTAFAADIDAFTLSGNGDRPRLPGLGPDDDRLYYGFVLWPNVFVNLLPDHVILHTLRPLDPERSHVTCDWLFDRAQIARSGFDPTDTVDIFDLVNRQDWEVCELTQLGMHSRAYDRGGLYVTNEQHIAAFRDLVLSRLGETGPERVDLDTAPRP